jgi:hypothetical protein
MLMPIATVVWSKPSVGKSANDVFSGSASMA